MWQQWKNGDSLYIYKTELASPCNICWKKFKYEIEMNTHTWDRYMERLSPQVVLGMIIPLLQVAYVLSMTRLRLIVISILMFVILYPKVRDGLGSHMRAMHVKKHNPFCRKEWFLGFMFCRKESATVVQEKWWVDLLLNFMKLIDLLVTNVTTSLNCSPLLEDTKFWT